MQCNSGASASVVTFVVLHSPRILFFPIPHLSEREVVLFYYLMQEERRKRNLIKLFIVHVLLRLFATFNDCYLDYTLVSSLSFPHCILLLELLLLRWKKYTRKSESWNLLSYIVPGNTSEIHFSLQLLRSGSCSFLSLAQSLQNCTHNKHITTTRHCFPEKIPLTPSISYSISLPRIACKTI